MSMPVKLSDDLVADAREEARTADRSITSQIEHWARLGKDAGNGRVERIERNGTRTVGRFVNRRFTADSPQRTTRRQ